MGLFSWLFVDDYSARARRDQRRFGTRVKNFISPVNDNRILPGLTRTPDKDS